MSYHCDPSMDTPVCQKPVHKGALGRHHIRVLFGLLLDFLLLGKLRAIVTRHMLSKTSAVRWRVESGWLFEDSGLGSAGRGTSTGWRPGEATGQRIAEQMAFLQSY